MKRCLPSGKSKDSLRVSASVQSRPLLVLNSGAIPSCTVAFGFGRLVLHWGHTFAIMCNCGGLHQRMHEKSSMQIIYTYMQNICSGYVSDALRKTKEHIKQLLSE